MHSNEVIEKTEGGIKESNKVLIQELIQDLEEKGIKPVVVIDGEVKNLRLVHETDLKDFEKELKNAGEDKADFCLLEADKTAEQDRFMHAGSVIVVYKKSGKIKEYKAGNASRWVADFALDLSNKFFN